MKMPAIPLFFSIPTSCQYIIRCDISILEIVNVNLEV